MSKTKTIMTIEELIKFCKEHNFESFSSSKTGYQLGVKVPATFEVEDSEDDNARGMLKLKFKLFHTKLNRNRSFVSDESANEAMPTIANRPILAYIHQLDNGEWDFFSHNIEEVEDEDGNVTINYLESQVGSFSSEAPFKEYDDERDVDFICVYGYIPREYTKAAEIIERKGGTKNSVELHIEEMSYNAKDNYLDLQKFYVMGSTLLGSDEDGNEIEEGMLGSRADIADFKAEEQTFEADSKLVKVLENLNETLSRFNINNNVGKEEQEVEKNELEQATIEDLNQFDLNDPDPAEPSEPVEPTEPEIANPEVPENNGPGGTAEAPDGEDTPTTNPAINDDDPDILNKIKFEIETTDGVKREFGLSVSSKMNAVYNLINSTYGEADNDFYDVDMFEEEGYVEMYGWFTGKNYRQTYSIENDVVSLTGERIEIFKAYVTAEQKEKLTQMSAQFESNAEKLRHYEEEPSKMEILESNDYAKVFATKEFEELKLQKNHFELEIDEVKAKADAILLDYAKHSNFNLLSEGKAQINSVTIPVIQKKENRYGNLFSSNVK